MRHLSLQRSNFLRYCMNPTDEYMTPPSAWEAIQKYIPKNKVIWEAFYGDGKLGDALRSTHPGLQGESR